MIQKDNLINQDEQETKKGNTSFQHQTPQASAQLCLKLHGQLYQSQRVGESQAETQRLIVRSSGLLISVITKTNVKIFWQTARHTVCH